MDEELLLVDDLDGTVPVEDVSDLTEQSGVSSEIILTGYVTQEDLYQFKEELFSEIREDEYTLWNKPLDKYSVTEGLLLMIFALVLWLVTSRLIGGVIKK